MFGNITNQNALPILKSTRGARRVGYIHSHAGAMKRTLEEKLRDVVSIKDFGVTGSGDETTKVISAIDSGEDILFDAPSVTIDGTLTVSSPGQTFYGPTTKPTDSVFSGGPNIIQLADLPLFDVQTYQNTFFGLRMTGPKSGNDVAINGVLLVDTDDLDLKVINCFLGVWTNAVVAVGRGLDFSENTVFNASRGVLSSWPTSGTSGTGVAALPLGYRAYRVSNNRAHSVATLVETSGVDRQYFRNAIIAGNQIDIGQRLFLGGISDSIIANNVVANSTLTPINIDAGGHGLIISNNQLQGSPGDTLLSPENGIRFEATATMEQNSITNNTIRYINGTGLKFAGTVSHSKIALNTITDVSQNAGFYCIDFDADVDNTSIIGNNLNPVGSPNCISAHTVTLTAVTITGNSYDSTSDTLLTGTVTDGGGNLLAQNGKIGIGTITGTHALDVVDTSSLPVQIERSGSSGGVGIRYKNTTGQFDVYAVPTGANAGNIIPSADNAIDFGSAAASWKDAYLKNIKQGGATGGAGSAGAGNQYVSLTVDGVTYKVLHDGTI